MCLSLEFEGLILMSSHYGFESYVKSSEEHYYLKLKTENIACSKNEKGKR